MKPIVDTNESAISSSESNEVSVSKSLQTVYIKYELVTRTVYFFIRCKKFSNFKPIFIYCSTQSNNKQNDNQ